MSDESTRSQLAGFLKSLGFPDFHIHPSVNHFDFSRASRRILVIGPMGSGKTEYSARVWRDSQVAIRKSESLGATTTSGEADRRKVFFIRSSLDARRFPDYPEDALAYRGGYERCGPAIARIHDSFELERVIADNPEYGTWIVDEASFYDERIAYVILRESEQRGLVFIFPTLILNFRKDTFNSTARLLLELSTDIFPLSAYCEHSDCLEDSFYTYRYYLVDGAECPALYFDPLIVIGGDRKKADPREPNYCTRCDRHHYLPGKEYTYLILKPLGVRATQGTLGPLKEELGAMHTNVRRSRLFSHFESKYAEVEHREMAMNALRVPCIAEKAALFLFLEQNLLSEDQLRELAKSLALDSEYLAGRLADHGRNAIL